MINEQIDFIKKRIQNASTSEIPVTLLAVSKGQTPSSIREAFLAGLNQFGENYLQEALLKQDALRDLPLEWHFIGPLQRNKTKAIATHFSWVHSLDRLAIAERLHNARPPNLPPLNVCIQVNLDAEESKSGLLANEVPTLAKAITALPRLRLRGLMIIPQPRPAEEQFTVFSELAQLMRNINQEIGIAMDTLSMGMSDDFETAIRAGSTIVRIGQAIFGARK